jgi:hypothetical protein
MRDFPDSKSGLSDEHKVTEGLYQHAELFCTFVSG